MVAVAGPCFDALHRRRGRLGGLGLRGILFGSGLALGLGRRDCTIGRDLTQQGAGGDGFAVFHGDLAENTGRGRIDLQGDLVGLEFADRLVRFHGVARLLEPAADRGLADRFAKGGNANLSRHGISAPLVGAAAPSFFSHPSPSRGRSRLSVFAARQAAKTSSMKDLSWARCFDMRPVAVAAAAGRPA